MQYIWHEIWLSHNRSLVKVCCYINIFHLSIRKDSVRPRYSPYSDMTFMKNSMLIWQFILFKKGGKNALESSTTCFMHCKPSIWNGKLRSLIFLSVNFKKPMMNLSSYLIMMHCVLRALKTSWSFIDSLIHMGFIYQKQITYRKLNLTTILVWFIELVFARALVRSML